MVWRWGKLFANHTFPLLLLLKNVSILQHFAKSNNLR